MSFIYTFFMYPIVLTVFWILGFKNEKIRAGFAMRKHKPWLREFPVDTRWVWFHVASGELEYAKPVIRELKKIDPTTKILVTFFSPSVIENLKKTPEIDFFVPMPWDTPWHWREFLSHYKPACLAISRTDTWPNMIWEAHRAHVPSILFSATLPTNSGRYASPMGRLFYGSITNQIDRISCVTDEDASNFHRLSGDPHEDSRITVDGDTRFDQVISRVAEKRPLKNFIDHFSPGFVCGSTWPEDEDILVPALAYATQRSLHAILAPHEPSPKHLESLEQSLAKAGVNYARYSQISGDTERSPAPVVIVDQVGILADLYRAGQIAFVGGSFKKSIHSVMEPAAAGCLTLLGPFHLNNREALALKKQGMAIDLALNHETRARIIAHLETILDSELTKTKEEIDERRKRILNFVASNQGVSRRIADWIRTCTHRQQEHQPQ